jgi:uncharacterized membrane protein
MGTATTRRKDIDLLRVRAAVEAAERRTSAEIVVSIAPFFVGRVWRAAERAFVQLGVARTHARNGVLVFVVPSRRQVIVLPDDGAAAGIEPSVWTDVATGIADAFARGEGTTGLVDGIELLSHALARRFPYHRADVNELPDQPHHGRSP